MDSNPAETAEEVVSAPEAAAPVAKEAKGAKRRPKPQEPVNGLVEILEGDSYLSVAERVLGSNGANARELAARLMRANFYRPLRAGGKLSVEEAGL